MAEHVLVTGPIHGPIPINHKDYPDGFTFGPPLFSQDAIGPESCCNDPMVGITSEMLQERGYDPSTVIPSAEDQIDSCIPLSGDERLMRLVLDNLLRNAWKFTGKKPQAVIEFGKTVDPQPAFFIV